MQRTSAIAIAAVLSDYKCFLPSLSESGCLIFDNPFLGGTMANNYFNLYIIHDHCTWKFVASV